MASNGNGAVSRARTSQVQLLVHSAPVMIDAGRPDGYLDFFNQTWLKYVGRPLEDLVGWRWTSLIHREDLEGTVEEWRTSLLSGAPFRS